MQILFLFFNSYLRNPIKLLHISENSNLLTKCTCNRFDSCQPIIIDVGKYHIFFFFLNVLLKMLFHYLSHRPFIKFSQKLNKYFDKNSSLIFKNSCQYWACSLYLYISKLSNQLLRFSTL